MRIAIASIFDPRALGSWSGCSHYLLKALEAQGAELEILGPLRSPESLTDRVKRKAYAFAGRNYLADIMDPHLADYARQTEAALARSDVDCLLALDGHTIARIRTDRPIFYFWDCTFRGNLEYPWFANLAPECIASGDRMESGALANARLAFYSSRWAVGSATRDHGAPEGKVRMVGLGANLDPAGDMPAAERLVDARDPEVLDLLFLGVDWHRKGGDLALAVVTELNRRGRPTRLTVAGVEPPGAVPDFVVRRGFLDKRKPEQRQALYDLIGRAHFLIVPSLAESFGCVFAEANAFATPALARRVGGLPSVIRDDVNGRLFDRDTGPEPYADYIQEVMGEPGRYRRLAFSSSAEFKSRLNWDRQAALLLGHMAEALAPPHPGSPLRSPG